MSLDDSVGLTFHCNTLARRVEGILFELPTPGPIPCKGNAKALRHIDRCRNRLEMSTLVPTIKDVEVLVDTL